MIRTLQFKYALKTDGVTAFMLNLYEHMDPGQVSCDFLVGEEKVPPQIKRRIEERGGRIYSIATACREKKRLAYTLHKVAFCYRLMRDNQYDLVHVHTDSAARSLILIVAGAARVRGRILHSHSAFTLSGKKGAVLHRFIKPFLPLWTNGYLTCSEEAARWMFPPRITRNGRGRKHGPGRRGSRRGKGSPVVMIPNGIRVDDFCFSVETRRETRRRLGASGQDFWLCTTGRLSPEKNYGFLLLVLKELIGRTRTSSGAEEVRFFLMFIGDGPEEEELRKMARKLEVDDRVRFLGKQEDVPGLLMGADAFLLSSLFEGLPLVLVEAQAAGLPCVASDRITRQVELTGLLTYLPVAEPADPAAEKLAQRWARQIQAVSRDREAQNWRPEGAILVREAGFDVADAAKKTERYYRTISAKGIRSSGR